MSGGWQATMSTPNREDVMKTRIVFFVIVCFLILSNAISLVYAFGGNSKEKHAAGANADETQKLTGYVVAGASKIEDLDHDQSDKIAKFTREVWGKSGIQVFRCKYGEGEKACRAEVNEKPVDADMTEAQAKKLQDITKFVWDNNGFSRVLYVDCSLAKINPKCQAVGGIDREIAQLKAGECVVDTKR